MKLSLAGAARRRMRRLHLLDVGVRWPPETFVGWKLEGLAARGMRVTVASSTIFDPDARLRGVELVPIPRRVTSRWAAARAVARAGTALLITAPHRLVKLVRGIKRHFPAEDRRRYGGTTGLLAIYLPLARFRPDLVNFEWNGAATRYLPLFDVWGCPVTTSCRGSDISVNPHIPGRERYAALLPEVLGRVSAVHCIAASVKREALEFGLDPAKATVIRPGVDPEVFRAATGNGAGTAGSSDAVLRVAMVGWLRWEKGYEYALEAIRGLLDRDVPVQLDIFGAVPGEWRGKGGERERIRHTAADLGLERQVHLRGEASSAEINSRLQASDVFLHPSLIEGIPTAMLEAMACEVPVVATDCGGVPEAVTDGVEGIVVAPREAEQLTQAMLRLWRDPGLRIRMGRAGRARVLSEFTLEHEHEAFVAMYREVTGVASTAMSKRSAFEGSPGERAEVLDPPHGNVDPGPFQRDLQTGSLRVLSAGSLTWEQGFEHSVHAVRLLLDMGIGCEYRILGDGDHLPALACARHQLGLADHVHFLQVDGEDRLMSEARAADVIVDPAVTDTVSPAALNAAQALGVPFVTTRRDGLPDDVGIVVPRRNPMAIAEGLADLTGARPD